MIDIIPTNDLKLIENLDAELFFDDDPAEYDSAAWMIATHPGPFYTNDSFESYHRRGNAYAFCGWKVIPHFKDHDAGFLYRAGVCPEIRGHGIQRRMIRIRESEMHKLNLYYSVSYTDADAAASMKNLIAEGYRPYTPTVETCLSGGLDRLGRCGFVHWIKTLR